MTASRHQDRAVRAILRTDEARDRMAALAGELGVPPEAVRRQVHDHLRFMLPDDGRVRRWLLRLLTGWAYGRPTMTAGTRATLTELRRLGALQPVIFLPSHRSYADSDLLATALRGACFPAHHRLAGDNLACWPFGSLARSNGTVFIRRTFGNDRVYRFAVRLYLAHALRTGRHLEWFAEGGRTRTGWLRRPRHGLLRELLVVLDQAGMADTLVVPVAVTFRVLPEARLLVAEDAGGGKPSESPWFLARYLLTMRRHRGRHPAHLEVGAPFSLRQAVAGASGRGQWGAARHLARHLAEQWNDLTPVTAQALIALVLTARQGEVCGPAALSRELDALLDHLRRRRVPVLDHDRLKGPDGRLSVLNAMVEAGLVTRTTDGGGPAYLITPDQWRFAVFHRHTAGHWFVPRAVAELTVALSGSPAAPLSESAFTDSVLQLHELLRHAFVLPSSSRFLELVADELDAFADQGTSGDQALRHQPFLLAPRIIGPAMEAFLAVARHLARHADGDVRPPLPPGGLVEDGCPARWPESQSRDLHRAALSAATASGLLAATLDIRTARERYAERLRVLVDRLDEMASLDAPAAPLHDLRSPRRSGQDERTRP
jgi:glycerol-3-phosphate O-acyltransferase